MATCAFRLVLNSERAGYVVSIGGPPSFSCDPFAYKWAHVEKDSEFRLFLSQPDGNCRTLTWFKPVVMGRHYFSTALWSVEKMFHINGLTCAI